MLPPGVDLYLRADLRRAHVLGASERARAWLYPFLTYTPPAVRGEVNPVLLVDEQHTFPVGLLEIVRSGATREGLAVHVHDERVPPVSWEPRLIPSGLYDYQREAVEAALRAGRGILKLATGAGKGNIVAAFPQAAQTTWVILVHRGHLLADLADRFEQESGERAGRVQAGEWSTARVTFATLQTLYANRFTARARDLFAATRGIIVDEAHTASADTFADVLERFVLAYWRIGLSATPFDRTDARGIFNAALLGPMLYDLDAGDLIDRGKLARPDIAMVRFPHDPDLAGLNWAELYRQAVVENEARNRLVVEAAVRLPPPCMLFVTLLDHGRTLLDMVRGRGLRADFISGRNDRRSRLAAVKDLDRGALDVCVANSVFNEGVNVRGLRSVVIAAGGASPIAALQRVGRVTRILEGKTRADVFDLYDTGVPSLERHSAERRAAYVREGYNVNVQDFPTLPAPRSGPGRLPGV